MTAADAAAIDLQGISEEDQARASLYRLLARLLARPASSKDLTLVAGLGGEGGIGEAMRALATVAGRTDAAQVAQEYHDLFVGIGRGELVPYGSYYLTGFLHEKPLAKLRNTMSELGVERSPDVSEPEDHIAAVMDIMAGLIEGQFSGAASDSERRFFANHVEPWAAHFFKDLENAKTSVFYAPVGAVGRAFVEIEQVAFGME